MSLFIERIRSQMESSKKLALFGKVASIRGMMVEIDGMDGFLSIGDRLEISGTRGNVMCEVIGFSDDKALTMPYTGLSGIGYGNAVRFQGANPVIYPSEAWLGRVVNCFAEPIDDKGALAKGQYPVAVRNTPPSALKRRTVGVKIDTGVRVINSFTTCCRGQRMGIFAGSGVGKSILMGMLTKHSEAEIIVIGLVGERGREVQEFLRKDLGEEGLKRAITVVATSDESALMRRDAAQTTLSIAEYFREQGYNVMVLMDSITRFAQALREIGLAVGEPPATRGYTPSVFAELPRLLERAGPGVGEGTITGLFTVLVEGDDHNEPISDAVRGILDGHIILDREIANRNRYPAVNVLRSVSRTMPDCHDDETNRLIGKARDLMATYENMAELIRLGAYRQGADPKIDEAIIYHDALEDFMTQSKTEKAVIDDDFNRLASIFTQNQAAAQNQAVVKGANPPASANPPLPNNQARKMQRAAKPLKSPQK